MPIEIDGAQYARIGEVAARYKVTANTIRTWIRSKIVPKPPYARQGRKSIPYFPESLLKEWDKSISKKWDKSVVPDPPPKNPPLPKRPKRDQN
jgi:hypothetical protein